jgi:8-oxo-dGTP diphosphatase
MSASADSYGGVVVDSAGRVLLREPAGHYDGYVWTFPKGRPAFGETPEQAALREVREETGWLARILEPIPGVFPGGTTSNAYFLMAPVEQAGSPDWETQAVRWASLEEARELIGQTSNQIGRRRDLAVLAVAASLLASRGDPKT